MYEVPPPLPLLGLTVSTAKPLLSSPNGPATDLYPPPDAASQPLFQPPFTAFATALETPSGPVSPQAGGHTFPAGGAVHQPVRAIGGNEPATHQTVGGEQRALVGRAGEGVDPSGREAQHRKAGEVQGIREILHVMGPGRVRAGLRTRKAWGRGLPEGTAGDASASGWWQAVQRRKAVLAVRNAVGRRWDAEVGCSGRGSFKQGTWGGEVGICQWPRFGRKKKDPDK